MQLLVDCVNDSTEQIELAGMYLDKVLELRRLGAAVSTPQPAPADPKAEPAKPVDPKAEPAKPAKGKSAKAEPAKAEPDAVSVAKTVSPDVVRQKMIKLQGEGKAPQLRALLAEFGAAKASEVPLERLAEFDAKLAAL